MKGYKAFNKGFLGCGGFQYEIGGREYSIKGKLEMCKNGFHFCKNLIDVFEYYEFDRNNTVLAEVEASGEIKQEGPKYCAERIKILREVSWDEVDKIIGDVRRNTGNYNSGSFNSGDYNSGNYNSGDYNIGYWNCGDYNSGHHNSGDHNSGHYNSGDFNSGHYNSGNYNNGRCNSGYFNSNTPTVRLFNKDSGMTFVDIDELNIQWDDLNKSKEIIKNLPNYDANIFYEATGIDWRDDEEGA